MKYSSTRGGCRNVSFEQAILSGWAPDGGCYLPERIPTVNLATLRQWSQLKYQELVKEIVALFVSEEEVPRQVQSALIYKAFEESAFSDPGIVRPQILANDLYILELFHGPTLAFKDLSMRCLAEFINYFVTRKQENTVLLVGTSGDTGSSAIEAIKGKPMLDIVVLLPKGRCSRIQERMMTTVLDDNVHIFSVDGTSDDLDEPIKAVFGDSEFVKQHRVVGLNSINWGRVMVQIVNYFLAYFEFCGCCDRTFGKKPLEMIVPTGAAGNITAALIAKKMGLPIHIVAAVTTNDIVYRTVNSGDYSLSKEVIPTLAPSMDIQVPYNMERILLLSGQNKEDIVNHMHQFEKTGSATVPPDILTNINTRISSFVANDELIKQTMRKCWNENQYLICPHTATAVAYYYSQLEKKRNVKCVCFATASPAKFAEAVLAAGLTPQPTKAVTELESKPTRYIDMPSGADWEAMLRAKIEKISRKS